MLNESYVIIYLFRIIVDVGFLAVYFSSVQGSQLPYVVDHNTTTALWIAELVVLCVGLVNWAFNHTHEGCYHVASGSAAYISAIYLAFTYLKMYEFGTSFMIFWSPLDIMGILFFFPRMHTLLLASIHVAKKH